MTQIRRQQTAPFKAQVVPEAIAGEKTLSHIAAAPGIHPNVITTWRQAVLNVMPTACDDEGKAAEHIAAVTAEHEREKEAFYAEIGRLTTQVNWLPKKMTATSGLSDPAHARRTRGQ